jgi:hypothetical protein
LNVLIKSFLSFTPFLLIFFINSSSTSDFNLFAYHFSIFNIFYGLFGIPIYQYILAKADNSKVKFFFYIKSNLIGFFILFIALFGILFSYLNLAVPALLISSLIYSYFICNSALQSRKNFLTKEILFNSLFFIPLILQIIFFGYSSLYIFSISSMILAIFAILISSQKNISNSGDITKSEAIQIFQFIIISGLGSLVSYGDIIIATIFLPSDQAFQYIWLNRGVLGATLLSIGLVNYLLSNNEYLFNYRLRILIILSSITISSILFLIVLLGLYYIFGDFLELNIYVLLFLIITMKYVGSIPSTMMIHLNLQFLRILSTIVAALIYLSIICSILYMQKVNLINIFISVFFYHFVIFVLNIIIIKRKKLIKYANHTKH